MCSISALLAMKSHALAGRYKQKDAYNTSTACTIALKGSRHWHGNVSPFWNFLVANAAFVTSPRSSTLSIDMGPLV